MSLYVAKGSPELEISSAELPSLLFEALDKIGERRHVLAVPPDLTRRDSRASELTQHAYDYYGGWLEAVLPALGTHTAMSPVQLTSMFGKMPHELFRIHNWRADAERLGEVPATFIHEQSEGKVNYAWPAQVNRLIVHGGFDLVLSLGQVVPHEVIGMANYNKNILIGTGGRDSINRSHYLGAVYGMERIMGRAENPVRCVLNYACDHFLSQIPIIYVLTVVGCSPSGSALRGVFIGDDVECFHRAAELSLAVNFEMLDRPIRKAVVYLDPHEYQSTWLGNKAIYRTRLALDDGADLIILAPGVKEFGEDRGIDALIRDDPDLCVWGRGYRLDELRGAVLRVQLRKLPTIIERMRNSKYRIRQALETLSGVKLRRIVDPAGDTGAFLITIYEDPAIAKDVNHALRAEGITTHPQGVSNVRMTEWGLHLYYNVVSLVMRRSVDKLGFPWSLLENAGSEMRYEKGTCPVADGLFERSIIMSIPSCLTSEDEADIIQAFKKVLTQYCGKVSLTRAV